MLCLYVTSNHCQDSVNLSFHVMAVGERACVFEETMKTHQVRWSVSAHNIEAEHDYEDVLCVDYGVISSTACIMCFLTCSR